MTQSDAPNEGREEKTDTIEWAKLKYQVGEILVRKFLEYNDGKFHTGLEFNPATHELTEFFFDQLSKEREKVQSLERWKKEEMEVWGPVLDYMQDGGSGKRGPIGSSISELVLQILKHHYEGKERETIKEKNAWIAEERTINKELAAENRKLESELIEEREIRKKLVGGAKNLLELIISENITNNEVWLNEEDWAKVHSCQSIIAKASELDNNKET